MERSRHASPFVAKRFRTSDPDEEQDVDDAENRDAAVPSAGDSSCKCQKTASNQVVRSSPARPASFVVVPLAQRRQQQQQQSAADAPPALLSFVF